MLKTQRNAPLNLITAFVCLLASSAVFADEVDLFENLEPIEDARVAMAYIDPEADFSVFSKVMILDTFVAFRSGWQRDQRRGTRGVRVTTSDMDRIKSRVSELFNSVLIETLEADDGFEIVDEPGDDVLLIRAAIIDLDITAPDTMTAGRSRTYTADSGAATLYIELFDSISGQIIGRAADRQVARSTTNRLTWSNRATNTADASRVFSSWAGKLREFLDSHYTK